ncbi:TIGR02594 family protein [uncultured Sphingomonas sp.]|uniref:TIGR02594 family protein n=1 Tax=uncultured Sphingomonas sp. TaxID=158754 RepID=UPI003453D02F
MTTTWLDIARKYLGTTEAPGPRNNPTIMTWAKRLGSKILGIVYNADSTPWCALFLAHVMAEAGFKPPLIAVRASSWDAWGVRVTKPFLGAIARFQRPGGGHVALIVGVDATGTLYRVLGGNQSDAVSETWIEAARCVAIRWPSGAPAPTILAPVVKRVGSVSKDEA